MSTKSITQLADLITFTPTQSGNEMGYTAGKFYLMVNRSADGSINDALSTYIGISSDGWTPTKSIRGTETIIG